MRICIDGIAILTGRAGDSRHRGSKHSSRHLTEAGCTFCEWTSLNALDDAIAVSRTDQLGRTIALAEASGGGWQHVYADAPPPG
ncbi:MAG: hypothetical protein ABW128_15950 [Rhizorhabdus sp.]